MPKCLFLLLAILGFHHIMGQTDSARIHGWYAEGMGFSESNGDSIRILADSIFSLSERIHFNNGIVYAKRLMGFYFENKAEYEKAIDYYMQALDQSKRTHNEDMESSLLTDLAAVYTENLKQPVKAKEIYLACVDLNRKRNDTSLLIATYTNLAAIYNRLGDYDSSLLFLQEGIRIAGASGKDQTDDLTYLYNNLGNTFFLKKQYSRALPYFTGNYRKHIEQKDTASIWLDALNIADTYIEEYLFDSAFVFANLSMKLADKLQSPSKQADSYSVLSKYYQRKGDFRNAYEYQKKWYSMDTALVNGETYRSIAELQEKYKSRERENERLLLQAEIDRQRFHNRIFAVLAISLLVAAFLIAIAFIVKRNANHLLKKNNDLILKQNTKLAELNQEKNSLISIVSHDLHTPFSTIGMWAQLLEGDLPNLSEDGQKAVHKIKQSTLDGEKLIQHILSVEKGQEQNDPIQLETVDLNSVCNDVMEVFSQAAAKKNIKIHLQALPGTIQVLSDRRLLKRICENLISNALKYTPPGRQVFLNLEEKETAVMLQVADEGVGISNEELPSVFSRYGKISSRPTNGEASTGLGLSIVKRLVDELNGRITCESQLGKGTVFTVFLDK